MSPTVTEERLKAFKSETLEMLCQCRQKFLLKFPFTASVMMRMELVPVRDRRLRTASTDGKRIYMDVAFCSDIEPEERIFVLAHEVWHAILLHMLRGKQFEREKFNIAADMEVNRLLRDEGIPVPRFALMPEPGWGKISAEEMYDKIVVTKKREREGGDKTEIGTEGQFDKHVRADDSAGDVQREQSMQRRTRQLAVWDKWGEVGYDPDYVPLVAVDVAETIRESVVAAAQQVERRRGTLPDHLKGVVGRLLKSEIDWKEALARFVTSAYGGSRRWLPPNRRHIGRGVYLQSSRQESLRAVVAIDTSGSTMYDLPQFFSELRGLLSSFGSYEITVIQCDAAVQHVEVYDGTRPIEENVFYGGGGTSFDPVFQYVESHPETEPSVLIYLTDGCGTVRETPPPYPVLWLLTADGHVPAKWGAVARFKKMPVEAS